ncbi:hypothetical protein LTR62_004158 [Meristemomyces frigidus]|uniref:Mitochondrial adapter protein MCP1 transmembrane domain-containing protein n=1 Tax=Meristemomyces frigidus TaxID=1508187 RepID=A0AAN7TJH2_9PEZI|nr:hypothetical protein LTR62_004158 [Meristemomyces frigidus]
MADYDRGSSLQELEPSPIEETPLDTKDSYFPSPNDTNESPSQPPQRPTHALGLSHHTPLYYLLRIQKYSSYIFTAFGAAHIINTSVIPLITQSVPESERYLLLTRPYYQGIPAEPLLVIIPLWAHVFSGVAIRVIRRNLNAQRYGDVSGGSRKEREKTFFSSEFWPKISGISQLGYPFLGLLAGHIFLNRVIPKGFPGGQSNVNLSYVSHAFARHPVVSYAGFTALIGVGVAHMTWGWAKWLGLTPDQSSAVNGEREVVRKRRWYLINGVAALVAGVWMAGGFGVIGRGGAARGWVGDLYDQMYRSIPVVGRWM